jgi:hypothetical protein
MDAEDLAQMTRRVLGERAPILTGIALSPVAKSSVSSASAASPPPVCPSLRTSIATIGLGLDSAAPF